MLIQILMIISRKKPVFQEDQKQNLYMATPQMQLDRSTFNNVSEEVLEVKTMLLQLRRVLEQVRALTL